MLPRCRAAAAHTLSLRQLLADVLRAAATFDTSFLRAPLATGPDGSPPALAPAPATDAPDSDTDDLAQPKVGPGPHRAARVPLPDAKLLSALRTDTLLVEDLRLHLWGCGLSSLGLNDELAGRLFEYRLAPSASPPASRPSVEAPSARSIVDTVALQTSASALTSCLAARLSDYPRLLSKFYQVVDGPSVPPSPKASFLHGLVVREVYAFLSERASLLSALRGAAVQLRALQRPLRRRPRDGYPRGACLADSHAF